ncbi:MAG: DUF3105 domain-containing protein [Nocardioides sp.]
MANQSKKQRAAERRAMVEKLQREQKARERRRSLIGGGVVVVLLLAIAGGVFFSVHKSSSNDAGGTVDTSKQVIPTTPTGTPITQPKPSTMKNPTDIQGVVAYDTGDWPGPNDPGGTELGHDHVDGPVKYAVTPPVGGPHNPVWMNAGLYTEPIPSERAVHNLEHGVVWITYRPDLPKSQVDELTALFKKQSMINEPGSGSNRFVDVSPWADNSLPAPVVISAWGYQLKVQSASDPRLQQFIDTFRHNQKYAPEYGSAVDGVPVSTGGNPALGSSQSHL